MAKKKETPAQPSSAASCLTEGQSGTAVPIIIVGKEGREKALQGLTGAQRRWLEINGFDAEAGKMALVPAEDGSLAKVLFGIGSGAAEPLAVGSLPAVLPKGDYALSGLQGDPTLALEAWIMGSYRFERYRAKKGEQLARLQPPAGADRTRALDVAESVWLARDLIMTPASDMGPEQLEVTARSVAKAAGASVSSIVGDALLEKGFPMIHAVGRASTRAPRIVDITWGREGAPRITLVGKGICFDTGGLDIKTADGMANMKKDMGGAATVLALGQMIMRAGLDVRLRLLLPIAENSISGNAFRPGDVLTARNGTTVEIGNTDAEGRLVLADAMALACEERPELLATFATLTGAARVALGPDLPPAYTDDDALAAELLAAGTRVDDPLWRMPLWMPYDKLLKSNIADVNHISGGPMAGSVTAALFLKRFAKGAASFLHLDIFAWVPRAKPARPEGAEPQGARALFEVLAARYGRR